MKTFPPLHDLTARKLPQCDESARQRSCSAFNADLDPRLGDLILEMQRFAFGSLIEGHDEPGDFDALIDAFGRAASTAILVGDVSFFDQARHAVSYGEKPTEAHNLRQNSLATEAHSSARLAIPLGTQGGATVWGCTTPHASQVAEMVDIIKGNQQGTTAESTVVDLCGRKAVSLPLAKGKRGPSKK
jgi:hypothetical protein